MFQYSTYRNGVKVSTLLLTDLTNFLKRSRTTVIKCLVLSLDPHTHSLSKYGTDNFILKESLIEGLMGRSVHSWITIVVKYIILLYWVL